MAKMVTFLITSLFVLAVLAVAVYLWQKPAASIKPETLPPSPGRGLFIDGTPDGIAQAAAEAESESIANAAAKRREIIERAKAGEKSALLEARNTANADLYEEALGSLAAGADSDSKLLALISYVTRHELRVNKKLAERLIDSYKRAPDRSSTSKVGVEIAGKRAEQRKSEGEGEAHYISQTGKAEAEKVRLMGEAQGVAYREQVNALGAQGVALVEVLKVIGEKGVRITPDIMASGGSGDGGAGGGIGTLLLLNLFRNQMSLPTTNGEKSVK